MLLRLKMECLSFFKWKGSSMNKYSLLFLVTVLVSDQLQSAQPQSPDVRVQGQIDELSWVYFATLADALSKNISVPEEFQEDAIIASVTDFGVNYPEVISFFKTKISDLEDSIAGRKPLSVLRRSFSASSFFDAPQSAVVAQAKSPVSTSSKKPAFSPSLSSTIMEEGSDLEEETDAVAPLSPLQFVAAGAQKARPKFMLGSKKLEDKQFVKSSGFSALPVDPLSTLSLSELRAHALACVEELAVVGVQIGTRFVSDITLFKEPILQDREEFFAANKKFEALEHLINKLEKTKRRLMMGSFMVQDIKKTMEPLSEKLKEHKTCLAVLKRDRAEKYNSLLKKEDQRLSFLRKDAALRGALYNNQLMIDEYKTCQELRAFIKQTVEPKKAAHKKTIETSIKEKLAEISDSALFRKYAEQFEELSERGALVELDKLLSVLNEQEKPLVRSLSAPVLGQKAGRRSVSPFARISPSPKTVSFSPAQNSSTETLHSPSSSSEDDLAVQENCMYFYKKHCSRACTNRKDDLDLTWLFGNE